MKGNAEIKAALKKTTYLGMLLVLVALAVFVIVALSYQLRIDRLQGTGLLNDDDDALFVFVHRVNTPARLQEIIAVDAAHPGLRLAGKTVRWAIETDVQFTQGRLLIAHTLQDDLQTELRAFLPLVPDSLLIVLDLKDSMDSDEAISMLAALTRAFRGKRFIVASFNTRILAALPSSATIHKGLLTWQIHPTHHSWLYRCFEFAQRLVGNMGGFIDETVPIDVVAYPWQSIDAEVLARLADRQIGTIAGSVDTDEALARLARNPVFGIFTDHPDLIVRYADPN